MSGLSMAEKRQGCLILQSEVLLKAERAQRLWLVRDWCTEVGGLELGKKGPQKWFQ